MIKPYIEGSLTAIGSRGEMVAQNIIKVPKNASSARLNNKNLQ
jgi:hypothetical protein